MALPARQLLEPKPARSPARSPACPPSPIARSLALAFGAFGGLIVAASPVPVRAQALPQGGVVVNGSATINQTGNRLTVVNTPGAAINWQSFNIGAGNTAHFQQQSAASSVLNRVIGPDPSQIYGALTSNGRVVLINPAGIAFGAGAAVDTAGFVASTVNISDADWRAGRLRFAEPGAGGTIQLLGANGQVPAANIRAQGGDIVLIAPQVDIASGAVAKATGGDVIIAAGRSVELTGRGYEGIRLLVQAPTDRATNLGKLEGDAVAIFAKSLKNFGSVQATGTTIRDGRVMLVAQDSAEVGGQITANRTVNGRNTGGNVTVLAHNVSLQGAQIDASGTHAGGQVNIGGNWQGRGDPLADAPQALAAVGGAANAQNTQVDAASRIDASVTQGGQSGQGGGNAGQVVVWADGRTDFAGTIHARGGSQGGDGGQVEVSGKQVLKFADSGRVDTRAPNGQWGSLLLDPNNFIVAAIGGDTTGAALGANIDSNGDLTVTSASGSVSAGSGDIFISDNVTWTNPNARVTFLADNNINLNSTLTNAGAVGTSPAITFISNNPTGTLFFGSTANAEINLGASGFATSTMQTQTNSGRTATLRSGFTVFQDKTWTNLGTVNFENSAQLRLNSFPPATDGHFVNNGQVNVNLSGAQALAEGRPSNPNAGRVTNAGFWTQNSNTLISSEFVNTGTLLLGDSTTLHLAGGHTLGGTLSWGPNATLAVDAATLTVGAGATALQGHVKIIALSGGIALTSPTVGSLNVSSLHLGAQTGINLSSNLTISTTPTAGVGDGGDIVLDAGGGISFGTLTASGSAGNSTQGGGDGGSVTVEASSGVVSGGAILSRGGDASAFSAMPVGGGGGTVEVNVVGTATLASINLIDVSGGHGANSTLVSGAGSAGGNAGSIQLEQALGTLLVDSMSLQANGGNGGSGGMLGIGGGNGGQGGGINLLAPTIQLSDSSLSVNGGTGGNAFGGATPATGGAGGGAGSIDIYGDGVASGIILGGNIAFSARGNWTGADFMGMGSSGFTQTSVVQLSSGTGGIQQTTGGISVPDASSAVLVVNTTGNAQFLGSNAGIDLVGAVVGGNLQANGVSKVNGVNVGGGATLASQTGGILTVTGPLSAGGAVELTGGSVMVLSGSSVQGSSVSLSATGGGPVAQVFVYGDVTSTSGDVSITADTTVRIQAGASVNSAQDLRIQAGPGGFGVPATVAVALGSGFGSGSINSTSIVAAGQVSINTGGGDLIVRGEESASAPNASVKLVSGGNMTLNLGAGTLSIEGGAAAGSFALVDPTNPGSQLNITAGAINITGGGATEAYAGMASVGDIINSSSAVFNVNPGVAGALVVAPNVATLAGLTIPPGSQASGPMMVDPNTGAVTVGGLPWAGGSFIVGLPGAAFPPIAPAPAPTVVTTNQMLLTILNTLVANQPGTSGAPSSNRRLVNGVVVTDTNCTPGS